jgi:hypothetical protein
MMMPRLFKNIRSVVPVMRSGCSSCPFMSLACVAAQAPSATSTPAAEPSKLPDWSGVWRLKGSPALLDVEDGKSSFPVFVIIPL